MVADKGKGVMNIAQHVGPKIIFMYPATHGPKNTAAFCKRQRKQRHKIEKVFGRLRDWWHTAISYRRWAGILIAAIPIATVVICWIQWVVDQDIFVENTYTTLIAVIRQDRLFRPCAIYGLDLSFVMEQVPLLDGGG